MGSEMCIRDRCLKVHLKSQFILNGVCVTWRGWLDLRRLDGVGRFEFDEERAQVEFVRYGTTRIRHITVLNDTLIVLSSVNESNRDRSYKPDKKLCYLSFKNIF